MRPPRRKAPVRRGTQPVPALERQPRGPQHLGPAAAERQSPGSVTPSPAWPPVIATPSVGVPFHRTSEYLRLEGLGQEPILSIKTAMDSDPVLDAVTTLLADKTGPAYPPEEMARVEADGMQRIKDKRPPGYADAKKEGSQALGDYVLWRQLLDEAATRKLPVLLVTNDQKEDWYRKLHGITIGPRIELISEMLDEAGVPFHAQTLERFLGSAAPILRSVKETTVTEVRRIAEADRTAHMDAKETAGT